MSNNLKCPPCLTRAERDRRYRERQKAGIQVYRVEVDQDMFEKLLFGRHLDRRDMDNHDKVSNAIVDLIKTA